MVDIKLDEKWSLQSDRHNWILCENERAKSFHSQLNHAIESYFEMKIRGSDAKSIKELIEYHNLLVTRLNQAIAPFKIKIEPI